RIANFVNGELWGRPTDGSWGMVFPGPALRPRYEDGTLGPSFADIHTDGVNVPRHPSQLYEAALEGLLLALVLAILVWRFGALKRPGLCIGVFLAGYGLGRFVAEFWRQYDPALGRDGFDIILGAALTRGQTLSLPMILAGAVVITLALRGVFAPKPAERMGGAP
ncbi:MAG: prolipoprotein diacylglyceryl transferase family protein, partial [Pseudomonadota bacterium]